MRNELIREFRIISTNRNNLRDMAKDLRLEMYKEERNRKE
jgi:hypothetical protein